MALKRDAAARIENLKILELDENATKDDIRKAYTRLALKCHPDKNPDDPLATDTFQILSKAYEELSRKTTPVERKVYCCPKHGHVVCDSDDELCCDDEESYSDYYDEELEELYERLFYEMLARAVFKRKFCAKKKRRPPTEEEEAEERFYEFLKKKYQEEESEDEDEFVLTEEDMKKFHTYEAWEEERNQTSKRRRRRRGKTKAERIPQTEPPNLTKKQLQAEQKRREQEMKEIGEELSKKIVTVSETKSAPVTKTTPDMDIDALVMASLKDQQEEKRKKEAAFQEKMKELEGQEKTQEKKKKRQEKKAKKKQQKLEPVPDLLKETESVAEVPVKHYEPFNHKVLSPPKFKGVRSPTVRDRTSKSSTLHQYFGKPAGPEVPTHLAQSPVDPVAPSTASRGRGDPGLLEKHMKMYHEMMKVQPQRHTEQQLRLEREKDRKQQQQRRQDELTKLRDKNKVQVQTLPVTTDGGAHAVSSGVQSRQQLLQKQREMERRRNEEEELSYHFTSTKHAPKTSAPKWYEKATPAPVGYSTNLQDEPSAAPKNNIWQKRQETIERKHEELAKLVPQSEYDEMYMLEVALSESQATARREAEARALLKEQRRSRFAPQNKAPEKDISKQEPEKDVTNQYPPNLSQELPRYVPNKDPPRYVSTRSPPVPSYSSKVLGSEFRPAPTQTASEDVSRPRLKTLAEACREKEEREAREKQAAAGSWTRETSQDWDSIWDDKPAHTLPGAGPKPGPNPGLQQVPVSDPNRQFQANRANNSRQQSGRNAGLAEFSPLGKQKAIEVKGPTGMWAQQKKPAVNPQSAANIAGGENWEDELENNWKLEINMEASNYGHNANLTQGQKSLSSFASNVSESSSTSSMEIDDWVEEIIPTKQSAVSRGGRETLKSLKDDSIDKSKKVDTSLPIVQNNMNTEHDNKTTANDKEDVLINKPSAVAKRRFRGVANKVETNSIAKQGTQNNEKSDNGDWNIKSAKQSSVEISEKLSGSTKFAHLNEVVNSVDESNQPSQRLPALADLTKDSNEPVSQHNKNTDKVIDMPVPASQIIDQEKAQPCVSSGTSRDSSRAQSPIPNTDSKPEAISGQSGPVGSGAAPVPGVLPFGLPAHLQQAYLQYIQQTSGVQAAPVFPQFGIMNPMMNPFALPWMNMFGNQQLGSSNQSPESSCTMQQNQLGMPQNPFMPQSQTAMPQNQSAMPQNHTAMPQNQSVMPQNLIGMSQNQFAMPQNQSALPQNLFAMQQNLSAMPQNQFAIPQNQSIAAGDVSNLNQVRIKQELVTTPDVPEPGPYSSLDTGTAAMQQQHVPSQDKPTPVDQHKELPIKLEASQFPSKLVNLSNSQLQHQNLPGEDNLRLPRAPSMSVQFPTTRSGMHSAINDQQETLTHRQTNVQTGAPSVERSDQTFSGRSVFKDVKENSQQQGWMSEIGNIKVKVEIDESNSEEIRNVGESQSRGSSNCYLPPHKRFEGHTENVVTGTNNWRNGGRMNQAASKNAVGMADSVDISRHGKGAERPTRGGFGFPRKRNWNTNSGNEDSVQETQNSGRSVGKGREGFWKPREVQQTAGTDRSSTEGAHRGFGGHRSANFSTPKEDFNVEASDERRPRGGFGRPAQSNVDSSAQVEVKQESTGRGLWKPRMRNPNDNNMTQTSENDKDNCNKPVGGGFGLPGRRNRHPVQSNVDTNVNNGIAGNQQENQVQTPRRGGFGLPPQKRTAPDQVQSTAFNGSGDFTSNDRATTYRGFNTCQGDARQSSLSDRFSNMSVEKNVAQNTSSSLRVRKERSRAILDMLQGMKVQDEPEQNAETVEQRSY